jgi:hypothetical protein
MTALKQRALTECENVEVERTRMAAEIAEHHKFLEEQRQQFQGVTETVLRAAAHLQLEEEKKEEGIRKKAQHRIDKLKELLREKEVESSELQSRLADLQKNVLLYEQSFQQIAAATGLSNPDEIVSKFFLKEDIRSELDRELELRNKRMKVAKAANADAERVLKEARDAFLDTRWRDVTVTQDKVREWQIKAEKRQAEIERTTTQIAILQEGLVALARRVDKMMVCWRVCSMCFCADGAGVVHVSL